MAFSFRIWFSAATMSRFTWRGLHVYLNNMFLKCSTLTKNIAFSNRNIFTLGISTAWNQEQRNVNTSLIYLIIKNCYLIIVHTSITSKSTCYNPYTCNLKYLVVLSKRIISLMANKMMQLVLIQKYRSLFSLNLQWMYYPT